MPGSMSGKAKGFRQVDKVLTEMRLDSKQAVFLYDACRNAPYGEGAVKEADGAAVRMFDVEGAAQIDAGEAASASSASIYISYATALNETANDDSAPASSDHRRPRSRRRCSRRSQRRASRSPTPAPPHGRGPRSHWRPADAVDQLLGRRNRYG